MVALVLSAVLAAVAAVPGPLPVVQSRGAKPALAKVIDNWHRSYVRRQIRLHQRIDERERRRIYGQGHLPDPKRGLTHYRALKLLLESAGQDENEANVLAVLHLASLGIDGLPTPIDQPSGQIRAAAQDCLVGFEASRSQDLLLRTASGEQEQLPRDLRKPGVQAAALEALGRMERPVFRPTLEQALDHPSFPVRRAAMRGLGQLGQMRSLAALQRALLAAGDPRLAREALVATTEIFAAQKPTGRDPEQIRSVMGTVIETLGEHDWRTDLAAVELLAHFRSPLAISAMIGVLERLAPDPQADRRRIRRGTVDESRSGRLRTRTHELLAQITGAIYPADRPEAWRAFWDKVQDEFEFPEQISEGKEGPQGTRATGFFGIPVRGSRVVFVIDVSGSMERVHFHKQDQVAEQTRISYARKQLQQTAEGLEQDTRFNVVFFSDSPRRWRSRLVPPSDSNLSSLRQRLNKVPPDGATNLFDAMEMALHLRTSEDGDRYVSPVDEIFLLSDGQPTAGKLTNPRDILDALGEVNESLQVRINTIYLGSGDSPFLRRLASENSGRYLAL